MAADNSLLDLDIEWKTPRNLAALDFYDKRYLQWLAPKLHRGIRERTLQGKLPDGSRTAPLEPGYTKQKRKRGKHAYRDGWMTGNMWRSLRAKVDNKQRFSLFFTGSHGDTYTTQTGKKRTLRNQDIANIWSGLGRAPRGDQVPSHAFMAADDQQEHMIQASYERLVIKKGFDSLPIDGKANK